jgi:SM-20-related protein
MSLDMRFHLHVVDEFFDHSTCRRLIDEIRRSETSTALTFGKNDSGYVDESTRKVKRAVLNPETTGWVTARLHEHLPSLRDYFEVRLSAIEEPQFLWYGPGDFFVAHQDGNTKLIQLESDRLRRTSLTIFLNSQSDDDSGESYSGGSLVFTDRLTGDVCEVRGKTGKLVAFRPELTHEVKPIKRGNRFTVVTWCRIVA